MSETPPYPPNEPNQPSGPYQPPPGQYPPGQYPPGQYPVAPAAPTSSKATTSLILGIVSVVMCGLLLGIPAMIIARQAKREIRESQGRLGGEGLATAGFVTGLIGTIWSVVVGLVFVALAIFGVWASETCHESVDVDGNSTLVCDD